MSKIEMNDEQLLAFGIEAVSLIKADGLYNGDIEAGRADALSDTFEVTKEELEKIDGCVVDDEHLTFYNTVVVPKERERLHKQARFVAAGIIQYLNACR